MIDPADKQNQPLALEQPKRGRGRPATGAAMTPAEKQKAYRERMAKKGTSGKIAEKRRTPAIGKTLTFELDEFDVINLIWAWDEAKKSVLKSPEVKKRLSERADEFRKAYKEICKLNRENC